MQPIRLFAATGDAVARIESRDGERFDVTLLLEGNGAQCVAVDPHDPRRVYAGTFDDGVYRTLDGGQTWEQVGDAIPHRRGLPSPPPGPFPPRPWTSHVRWIAPHHRDPDLLFVGIELGGVMRSRDGGATWEDRKPGTYHDSHCLATHPTAAGRVYEAAGGGVSLSSDAGDSWTPVDAGMDRHYVWGLAVDPPDPHLWYVSASYGPRQAHGNHGDAQGVIYRKRGDAPWQPLGGDGNGHGLPRPTPYMP